MTAWVTSEGGVVIPRPSIVSNVSACYSIVSLCDIVREAIFLPYDVVYQTVVPLELRTGQASIALTKNSACALSINGSIVCWNIWGGCIWSSSSYVIPPFQRDRAPGILKVPIAVSTNQVALTAGRAHTCSLSADGAVTCWGFNSSQPLYVPLWAAADQVAVSAGFDFTCVLSRSRKVQCWGAAAFDWDTDAMSYLSVLQPPASLPDDIVDIFTSADEACALSASRRLYCWGKSGRSVTDAGAANVPDGIQGRIDLPCVIPEFAPYAPDSSPTPPPPVPCGDAQLRAFPNYDLVGTRLVRLSAASEDDCRTACCAAPACAGYAFGAELLASLPSAPCFLLSNVTQLVPSNMMNAGLRHAAADAAA